MLWIVFLISIALMIIGLLLIGPQVHKHQIRPYSYPTWILRSGALMMFISLVGMQSDEIVIQLTQILATMLIASSIIIVNHELVQAGDLKHGTFDYRPSIDTLILIIGSLLSTIVLLLGFALKAMWANPLSFITMILVVILSARLARSAESRRADFNAVQSLSAQILLMGIILLVCSVLL